MKFTTKDHTQPSFVDWIRGTKKRYVVLLWSVKFMSTLALVSFMKRLRTKGFNLPPYYLNDFNLDRTRAGFAKQL